MAFDPYARSYEARGNSSNSVFDWGSDTPDFFKLDKAGSFAIDIIPFKIATKAYANAFRASVGDETYVLDIMVHKNVGPHKKSVLCPATFGKRCPICEQAETYKKEKGFESQEYKALRASRRVVYNIIDVDSRDKKIQVFETSHFNFEKEIISESKVRGEKKGIGYIRFGDLEKGMTIEFRTEKEKVGTGDYYKPKSFTFQERKPYPKSMLDEAFPLDKFLNVMDYDALENMLHGLGDDEDTDNDEPVRSREEREERDEPRGRSSREEEPTRSRSRDEDKGDLAPVETKPAEKCPHGQRFGYFEKDDAKVCDKCEMWRECRRATDDSK